jgi:DNA-binding LacI/PurR family transcriptional regulator
MKSSSATPPKRVTLRQIAAEAGVSRPTVTMVLNGSYPKVGISEGLADRVRAIAGTLGYRVNYAAQCVSRGTFNNVAFVVGTRTYTSSISLSLLGHLLTRLGDRNLHLTMARVEDEKLTDPDYMPQFLHNWMCDGLLLNYSAGVPPRLRDLVAHYRLPAIWLNYKAEGDCVHPDDFDAGLQLTRHVLAQGHTRIAYADGSYHLLQRDGIRHYSKEDRLRGYRQAMETAGAEPLVRTDEDWPHHQFCEYLARWYDSRNAPTAVIFYSPDSAAHFRALGGDRGLRFPVDVALSTFGGDRDPLIVAFGTTVANHPWSRIAEAALDALMRKIADPQTVLPPQAIKFDIVPAGQAH